VKQSESVWRNINDGAFMGLFDSVLGAVMNNGQRPQEGQTGSAGLGGLIGMVASNPQLVQAVMGMLSNDGAHGGLGGLVSKFQQAGLGGAISSWIGGGPNQAVSGEEITNALGDNTVSDIAGKLGVEPAEAAEQI
jgi:uncharacterized protein YidB (DUF937 family)